MGSQLTTSRRKFVATVAAMDAVGITTATRPHTVSTPARATPDERVIGYYPAYKTHLYPPEAIPLAHLTDVVYAFLKPQSNGDVVFPSEASDTAPLDTLQARTSLRPDTQLHLAIGGGTYSDTFPEAANTATTRTRFAETAVEKLRTYNADGLHIDWEHPTTATQADNFRKLLAACRDHLEMYSDAYELTIAVAGREYSDGELPHRRIANLVDAIYVMTYDYAHSNSAITGLNAPLYPYTDRDDAAAVDESMQLWHDDWDVPADKLVVGIPFYGRGFAGVANANNGLGQSFTDVPEAADESGAFSYTQLSRQYLDNPAYERYWHKKAKVPWLYSSVDDVFISYDDSESVQHKVDYTRANGFAGVMLWELAHDQSGALQDTVAVRQPPSPPLAITRRDITGDGTLDIRARNQHVYAQLTGADVEGRDVVSAIGRAAAVDTPVVPALETRLVAPDGTRPAFQTTHAFSISTATGDRRAYRVRRRYTYGGGREFVTDVETSVRRDVPYVVVTVTIENTGEEAVRIEQPSNTIHQGLHLVEGVQLAGRADTDSSYAFYLGGHGGAFFREVRKWTTFPGTEWATFFDDTIGMTFGLVEGATSPYMWIEEDAHLDFLVEPLTVEPDAEVTYTVIIALHDGGRKAPRVGRQVFNQAQAALVS